MKISSTSAVTPGMKKVTRPAAMPAMPTSASHQREPTLPPMIACAKREHAIDQRECAVEQDQRQQRDARPDEGENAEDNRRDPAQQDQPPVLRKYRQYRRAGGERQVKAQST